MKIKAARFVYEEIEVETPYYFCQYLDPGQVYGRITEKEVVTVNETKNGYEVEIDYVVDTYGCYVKDEYACDEKEFLKALYRAKAHIEAIE